MTFGRSATLIALLIAAFAAGNWYSSRSSSEATSPSARILYYQDPMHPAYRSDKPGVAPDCGMKLVPVYAQGAVRTSGVRIDDTQQRLLGIRVAPAELGGGQKILRTLGRVSMDTTRLVVANAPTEGWTTALNFNTGDQVKQGQVLGAYFARELRPSALGHLAVMDRQGQATEQALDPGLPRADRSNVGLSLEILHNLGMSDLQIRALEQSRTIPDAVEMRSPQSGVVVARSTSVGQRFERGDELYRIADLQHVWILADLFPDDARLIPAGATALVHGGEANQTLHARVSNSVPEVDPVAQTVKLRLDAENPGLVLKPNMFVDIEVSVPMPRGLTVPTEAVLDSGNGKTVFVKTAQDTFEARAVETGWRSNGRVQVTKGLKAGENVAVSGQFLIDSETRLAHP